MFAEISKSGNYDCIQKISNPFLVANLIKRFFANLKVPVIPFHIFEQLMHDQGVAGKVAYVKGLIQQLP